MRFTFDFIEALSHILEQNDDVQKNSKKIEMKNSGALCKALIKTLNPKYLLIISCRNNEFAIQM